MWKPFREKPETAWEALTQHIMHREPNHTSRNIALALVGLALLSVILFFFLRDRSQFDSPLYETVIHVSGETTPDDTGVKPGEICMKHPDIFVLNYTESGTVNTGAIDKQMQAIQDLAQKGAIALTDEGSFQKSLERGCFTGNPLWIISSARASTTELLTPIVQKHFIPLFTNTTDWNSLTGYTIEQIDVTNLTSTESLKEILRKYLEFESGGIFKNL